MPVSKTVRDGDLKLYQMLPRPNSHGSIILFAENAIAWMTNGHFRYDVSPIPASCISHSTIAQPQQRRAAQKLVGHKIAAERHSETKFTRKNNHCNKRSSLASRHPSLLPPVFKSHQSHNTTAPPPNSLPGPRRRPTNSEIPIRPVKFHASSALPLLLFFTRFFSLTIIHFSSRSSRRKQISAAICCFR